MARKWSEAEVKLLIELWGEESFQKLEGTKRNKRVYYRIAKALPLDCLLRALILPKVDTLHVIHAGETQWLSRCETPPLFLFLSPPRPCFCVYAVLCIRNVNGSKTVL